MLQDYPLITSFSFDKCRISNEKIDYSKIAESQQIKGTCVRLISAGSIRDVKFQFCWKPFSVPNPHLSPYDVLGIITSAFNDRKDGGLSIINNFFLDRSTARWFLFLIAHYLYAIYYHPASRRYSEFFVKDKACVIMMLDGYSPVVFIFQKNHQACWMLQKIIETDIANMWKRMCFMNYMS